MKAFLFLLGLVLLSFNCQSTAEKETKSSVKAPIKNIQSNSFQLDSIQAIFQKANLTGTFVVKDLKNGETIVYNKARAQKAFLPASTFKIPNSLIALETKVVKNGIEIIPWNGKEYRIKNWNQDQSLRSAIKYSCVWFYQELARRVGTSTMQQYLEQMNYGNSDISAGIDLFWLTGNFKISALEQVDFLEKFYLESFPFSNRNYKIVKDAIIVQKNTDYTLRAKTGWNGPNANPQIAWYIGYLEKGNDAYLFAMNFVPNTNQDLNARQAITHRVFQSASLIPRN